jgi:hypothetical protein
MPAISSGFGLARYSVAFVLHILTSKAMPLWSYSRSRLLPSSLTLLFERRPGGRIDRRPSLAVSSSTWSPSLVCD